MAEAGKLSDRSGRNISLPVDKKQSTKIHDPNVEVAFGWNRLSLRVIGLWPHQTCKKSQSGIIVRCFPPVLAMWLSMSIVIPQISATAVYTFILNDLIEIIANVVGFTGVVVRILALWSSGEVLAWYLSVIKDDWAQKHTAEEQELMMKNAKLSRAISIGISSLAMSFFVSYLFIQTIGLFYIDFNATNGTDFDKHLFMPSYFPFDVSKRSIYAFIWVTQLFASVFAALAYSSADSFIAGLILHLCGQITILRYAVSKLIDHDNLVDSEIFRTNLASIVKRHNTLTKLAEELKDAVNLMLLVQLLDYTIHLGLQLFRLMVTATEHEPGQFPLTTVIFCIASSNVIVVHLFGACYIGEMLIQESEEIGMACYSCKWYNLSQGDARDLVLVMQRASNPLKMWAGQFVPFSMELFGTVLKTSMGYFSLLVTMNEQSSQAASDQ